MVLGRLTITQAHLEELLTQVDEERETVAGLARRARDLGATWRAIAEAAGVSGATARRRWIDTDESLPG